MDVRQQARPQDQVPTPAAPRMSGSEKNMKMQSTKIFFLLASVLVALGIVWVLMGAYGNVADMRAVNGSEYQALFLTNGQVYFGHLSNPNGQYVKLVNIYYLQVQQAVQPPANSSTSSNSNQQVSLAKLGNELHGPEDIMYVEKSQVLFWENLKSSGKVTQAINQYIASQKK